MIMCKSVTGAVTHWVIKQNSLHKKIIFILRWRRVTVGIGSFSTDRGI